MLTILFAILIGIGLSFQTAINARLRGFVGSPFLASTISFTVGTLFLIVIAVASGQNLTISYQTFQVAPWWVWIGGFLGVIGLTTNILIFPHLGGVQTAIMPLLGQILIGMLIDHFGWFNSAQHVLNNERLIGTLLVLTGIFFAVALPEIRLNKKALNPSGSGIWFWRFLGVVAGALTAMQTAVNGELGRVLHSPVRGAFVSFLVGALTLIVFTSVKEGRLSRVKQAFGSDRPRWLLLGGVLGGSFVFGSTLLVPTLGTGQTVIFALLGLIVGSLFVDKYGLFGVARKVILSIQLVGLLVLMSGVALIRLF